MSTTLGKKRRGISGLMQVAMIVGIVIIFSGVLFAFAGDIFDVQTVADSVSLQKISVQKAGSDAFLSVNAKNTGNSDIAGLDVNVLLDTDPDTSGVQPFTVTLSPSPLAPGMTGSAHAKLTDSGGKPLSVSSGEEVVVILNATTSDGSSLTEPATVRVR